MMVITQGLSLISQLRDDIANAQKEKIGMIGGGILEPERITVASIQTLALHPHSYVDMLGGAGVIFVDEAHHSPAQTFKSVLYLTNKSAMRIGTTATYRRAESEGDMLLKSVTGKILFKRSISEMIKEGWLAKPTIFILSYSGEELSKYEITKIYDEYLKGQKRSKEPKRKPKQSMYAKTYMALISHNYNRSKMVAEVIKTFNQRLLSSVTFVVSKHHGDEIIKSAINDFKMTNEEVIFMKGADKMEFRNENLTEFRQGRLGNIICTRIINEGIDFPEANAGIRAGAQTYEGTIIQQLGRILRKTKPPGAIDIDRNETQRVFWVDVCDTHNKYLASHGLDRLKAYESEKEFEIVCVESVDELGRRIDERISETKIVRT